MYIVTIENSGITTAIHDTKQKLTKGSVVAGINAIDTFSFSMLPDNVGFTLINDFTTFVKVYNSDKDRYEFIGRVLYSETTMDESGLISKSVTCESLFGYLCDSVQTYVDTQNWTVSGLLQHLIDCHNSQVEEYKQFKVGEVTAEDSNDNLYLGISRQNTWESIKSNLLDIIGGELQYRVEDDGIYIDYLHQIGEEKTTEIAMSVNMKAITREKDPTSYVTRLIPLGCKLTTEDESGETVETEERLDITSVTGGVNYIEDEEAVAVYGIHVGVVEWDDVTVAGTLYNKGKAWLEENNKVMVKYSVTALDLSLIGLALDDFIVGNIHPIKNSLLGIDDKVRIIKKNIDVCEAIKSTIEVGDNFKTLSDIQKEQAQQLQSSAENIKNLESSSNKLQNQLYLINKQIAESNADLEESFTSQITQLSNNISLSVSGSLGSEASIVLTVGDTTHTENLDLSGVRKAFADDPTAISVSAGIITFESNTIVIDSTNFSVTAEGVVNAISGTIGAITLSETGIYSHNSSYTTSYAGWYRPKTIATTTECFFAGATDQFGTNAKFLVTYGGEMTATDATINGTIITEYSSYKAMLDGGGLALYFDDVLCGTVNTKYWDGASTEGISLRVEEGGHYIMFSHADDTQGSGYTVDYYLNAGWSSNYEEMHIFQTSARFLDDVYLDGRTDIGSLVLRGANGERYLVTAYDGVLECSEI